MDILYHFLVFLFGLCLVVVNCQTPVKDPKRGALIGKLKSLQHKVSGTVWAVDEDTFYLENFNYDGLGPDAFFWVGNDSQPSPRGLLVPYPIDTPNDKQKELRAFTNENVILHLPPGHKIQNLVWFSVWCRRFTVDFGHVYIPANLDPPKKRVLPEFKRLAHGVRSGNVTILDAKTFYIPNLHYDGAGPDAFFWVGQGTQPNQLGTKVPNEMGSYEVLRGYEGEDIEIQLPDNITVFDIGYLSIWCVEYRHDFGHVLIPPAKDLWIPPALGQTRVKSTLNPLIPRDSDVYETNGKPHTLVPIEFDNCLQVNEKLQVEWQAGKDDVQIKLTARIQEDQYMAFGISSDPDRPQMINSDVVIAFYNSKDGSFHAVDYTMASKSQCDGSYGVCPDESVSGRNDASVIRGERKNGITSVIYSRPYDTSDSIDISIVRGSKAVTIVAAIGKLNGRNEANYHQEFVTNGAPIKIDFNSIGQNTCTPLVPEVAPKEYKPWPNNILRDTYNFSATIGPTGGDRGFKAITGNPSWGIAWWINGMLIPEIYVERGQTYYFTVEGGDSLENPAKHHPFYITDSSEGGFNQKTLDEQKDERIYAGVQYSRKGTPTATAQGRLCEWSHRGTDSWKQSETFAEYKNTLHKVCESGKPGSLVWTVAKDTPDTLYYQCYTHRHLGWKIHVNDPGFNLPHGSGASRTSLSFLSLLVATAFAFR